MYTHISNSKMIPQIQSEQWHYNKGKEEKTQTVKTPTNTISLTICLGISPCFQIQLPRFQRGDLSLIFCNLCSVIFLTSTNSS